MGDLHNAHTAGFVGSAYASALLIFRDDKDMKEAVLRTMGDHLSGMGLQSGGADRQVTHVVEGPQGPSHAPDNRIGSSGIMLT